MFPFTNHIEIVMAMKQVIQIRCKNNKKIVNVNIGSTVSDVLNEINLRGTTVVIATHAKDIVDKMKKRVIEIEKGIIVRDDRKGGYNK